MISRTDIEDMTDAQDEAADAGKLQRMRDANWRPAVDYWRDRAGKAEAEAQRLTAENDRLFKSGKALMAEKHKEQAEAKLWFEQCMKERQEHDLARPSQAGDERVARQLEIATTALRRIANTSGMGLGSRDAQFNQEICREALAEIAALAAMDTPKSPADGGVAAALFVVASVLQAETQRKAGAQFNGNWSLPALQWRGTVADALDMADAALASLDTPLLPAALDTQGGEG